MIMLVIIKISPHQKGGIIFMKIRFKKSILLFATIFSLCITVNVSAASSYTSTVKDSGGNKYYVTGMSTRSSKTANIITSCDILPPLSQAA